MAFLCVTTPGPFSGDSFLSSLTLLFINWAEAAVFDFDCDLFYYIYYVDVSGDWCFDPFCLEFLL